MALLLGPTSAALDEIQALDEEQLRDAVAKAKLAKGKMLHLPLARREGGALLLCRAHDAEGKVDPHKWFPAAKKLVTGLLRQGGDNPVLVVPDDAFAGLDRPGCLRALGRFAEEAIYQYSTTLTSKKHKGEEEEKPQSKSLHVLLESDGEDALALLQEGQACGVGVNLARQLANLPGNYCTPAQLGRVAEDMGKHFGDLKVKVLKPSDMEEEGMLSLLSVGRGSKEPSRLVVLQWRGPGGSAKKQPARAIVGKGITFDTGGISIKPSANMDQMKFDMGGAAAVLGTVLATCLAKRETHLVGVIAAAENMPSGTATKPGDVVTAMDGTTIEVLNTDAEGRLVLADALCFVKRYEPQLVVDLATLTGACVVALGHHASAVFSEDDDLAEGLVCSGEAAGDRAWRMPMWDVYGDGLKSNFADIANIGGSGGGSAVAARFLAHFAKGYRWAHMDIAGTAWTPSGPKAATGRPVPLLFDYLSS